MSGDLLGTVLQAKPSLGFLPDSRCDAWSVAAVGCTRIAQTLSLFGPLAAQPAVAAKLAADGGGMAVEQLGDLALFMAGFDEGVNLVSFVLGLVCVVHWATSTWWLMGQNAHAF
jgi:hypothetical protein